MKLLSNYNQFPQSSIGDQRGSQHFVISEDRVIQKSPGERSNVVPVISLSGREVYIAIPYAVKLFTVSKSPTAITSVPVVKNW